MNPTRSGSMGRAASRQIAVQMRVVDLCAEARNYAAEDLGDANDKSWSTALRRLEAAAVRFAASLTPKQRADIAKASGELK